MTFTNIKNILNNEKKNNNSYFSLIYDQIDIILNILNNNVTIINNNINYENYMITQYNFKIKQSKKRKIHYEYNLYKACNHCWIIDNSYYGPYEKLQYICNKCYLYKDQYHNYYNCDCDECK